jgi:hypothetical protein
MKVVESDSTRTIADGSWNHGLIKIISICIYLNQKFIVIYYFFVVLVWLS